MENQCFHDFDAFAETVRDANFEMLLQNPKRRTWSITQINLAGVHIQLGQEGSGAFVGGLTYGEASKL